jgi:hypothetical protein
VSSANGVDTVTTPLGTLLRFSACPYSTIRNPAPEPSSNTGWVEDENFYYFAGINTLKATWHVPGAPSSYSGQVIFFFDSETPSDGSEIVQPVLQYGLTSAGGGAYWAIASWYLTGGNTYVTSLVNVSTLDSIEGEIWYTCSNNLCREKIMATDTSTSQGTVLWATAGYYYYGQIVMEGYYEQSCNQWSSSASVSFNSIYAKDMSGYTFTPSWNGWTNTTFSPSCSYVPSYQSPSTVWLTWSTT